jgi:hypothetical protein
MAASKRIVRAKIAIKAKPIQSFGYSIVPEKLKGQFGKFISKLSTGIILIKENTAIKNMSYTAVHKSIT